MTRRVPKFGFTSRNHLEYQIVNVETLEMLIGKKKLDGLSITPASLYEAGAISKKHDRVKILGNGDLKSKLAVRAHAFSKSALSKIEAAGGTATVLAKEQTKE